MVDKCMKIDKKIECPNCRIVGFVRVRRKDSVSRKGKSWIKKRCNKCGYTFER